MEILEDNVELGQEPQNYQEDQEGASVGDSL